MSRRAPTGSDTSVPILDFPIRETVAYLDTLKFWRKRLPPNDVLGLLRLLFGPRLFIEDHYRGPFLWWLISINQPTPDELAYISELPDKWPICRADIAVDFICANQSDARRAETFLKRHVVQKWPGKRRHNEEYSTTYRSINKATARNIAMYADKPSKTGLGPCAHFELRFSTAKACRRARVDDLRRLMNGIDALAMLKHETRLVWIDRLHLNRLIEKLATDIKGHLE